MQIMQRPFSVMIISLLLNACVSTHMPSTHDDATMDPTKPDPAAAQLAEAATSVSQSLNELAAIQQAATPPLAFNAVPDPASYHIPGSASMDWAGPVEPLLQRITRISGFHLRVLGVRPPIPVVVSISAKDMPIGDIVRNIAYQVTKAATIWVYPENKVIELRYLRG